MPAARSGGPPSQADGGVDSAESESEKSRWQRTETWPGTRQRQTRRLAQRLGMLNRVGRVRVRVAAPSGAAPRASPARLGSGPKRATRASLAPGSRAGLHLHWHHAVECCERAGKAAWRQPERRAEQLRIRPSKFDARRATHHDTKLQGLPAALQVRRVVPPLVRPWDRLPLRWAGRTGPSGHHLPRNCWALYMSASCARAALAVRTKQSPARTPPFYPQCSKPPPLSHSLQQA
jgi:hypothetical protein